MKRVRGRSSKLLATAAGALASPADSRSRSIKAVAPNNQIGNAGDTPHVADKEEFRACPDCRARPGQPHNRGCDVERCSHCGLQSLSCGAKTHDPLFSRWTGFWPGYLEARELGLDLNEFMVGGYYKAFFIKPRSQRRSDG